MKKRRQSIVVATFCLGGLFSAVASIPLIQRGILVSFREVEELHLVFLRCLGIPFALAMAIAMGVVFKLGLLRQVESLTTWRAIGGTLIIAVSYPIGLMIIWLSLLIGGQLADRSGNLGWIALHVGLLLAGIATVFSGAWALRIIIGVWPPKVWRWAVAVSVGVPIIAGLAATVTLLALPALRSDFPTDAWWVGGMLIPIIIPSTLSLLILIGETILGGLIGHWVFQMATMRTGQ